jgi:ABC-type sugar transport system permease subunit
MTEAASSWQTYASIWTTILFTIGSVAVEMLVGLAGAACLAAVTLSLVGRFASVLK